jgi:2,3-bisphosphoglycerate-independent phosphoglycerate mutase
MCRKVITAALANDYTTIVIADHGNCETMINPDGSPNTAHTTNPVPIILVDKGKILITSLRRYRSNYFRIDGYRKPAVMTQHSLL